MTKAENIPPFAEPDEDTLAQQTLLVHSITQFVKSLQHGQKVSDSKIRDVLLKVRNNFSTDTSV